jgi:hypothetical protein
MIGSEGGMPGPHRASGTGTRVASQRELARRLGISHTALQKAARSGRIAHEPDGRLDIEKVRARLGSTADPARKTGAMADPLPQPPPCPAMKQLPIGASVLDPPPSGSSYRNARTANEVLKAQERKLRLEERKGQLADKARALLLVHRLAKEERDAILGWPARVAAEMAAELGVDAHRPQTNRQHHGTATLTRPPIAWIHQASKIEAVSIQWLGSAHDHDPFTLNLPGAAGRTKSAIGLHYRSSSCRLHARSKLIYPIPSAARRARSSRRRTLPMELRGRSGTKRISFGTL